MVRAIDVLDLAVGGRDLLVHNQDVTLFATYNRSVAPKFDGINATLRVEGIQDCPRLVFFVGNIRAHQGISAPGNKGHKWIDSTLPVLSVVCGIFISPVVFRVA